MKNTEIKVAALVRYKNGNTMGTVVSINAYGFAKVHHTVAGLTCEYIEPIHRIELVNK